MKSTLVRTVIVLLAVACGAYAWYHSGTKSVTPSPDLTPAPTTADLVPASVTTAWNREVPLQLATPEGTHLDGVAPFLAHQFETPAPTPQPSPSPAPSPITKKIPTAIPTRIPAESQHPVILGLQELAGASDSNRDSRIYGARSGGSSPEVVPTSIPSATPTVVTSEFPRVYGQATGYAMLYLMHPKARQTVEGEIRALLRANLESIYISALVDGTFQVDFPYLESVVRRLNGDGRKLTLVLYFSSGPTMRRYETTPIVTAFSQIDPEYFRYLIKADSEIRQQFIDIVTPANAVYDLNRSLNPANSNFAVVMLEDNLDRDSYRAMRELAQGVLAGRADMMRNPCPGCYSGNDADPLGDALESHNPSDLSEFRSGDGFTLDGTGFSSPVDDLGGQPAIEAIKLMKQSAIDRGARFFGLWRKQRQGLGDQLIHPDDRVYEVPTQAQEDAEIGLLRHGLSTTEPP